MKFVKCLFVFGEVLLVGNLLWRCSVVPGTRLQGCYVVLDRLCAVQGHLFWVASGSGNHSVLSCQDEHHVWNGVPLERRHPFLILIKVLGELG